MPDSSTLKLKPLAERRELAFKMRKAGKSAGSVAKTLGFKNAQAVDEIVARALAADSGAVGTFAWHDLELARLDEVYSSLMGKMLNGADVEEKLLKVADYRSRLENARTRPVGALRQMVDKALGDLTLSTADEAAAQSLKDMATMIDSAMAMGTTDDHRRAINAMATFRNQLNDLGASPAAREELDGIVTSSAAARSSAPVPEVEGEVDGGAAVLSFMDRAQQRYRRGTA